ncbi:Aldo/keto reductase, partial [Pluteus cervinus]
MAMNLHLSPEATMRLPKIMYGTAWKKERTVSLVTDAVLKGFWAIDTACQPKHYREDLVGAALLSLQSNHGVKREDLFLQTKFTSIDGQDRTKPLPYDPQTSITQQILTSFQTSLRNLHTTFIDSYILHSPMRTVPETIEAWKVLIKLQDQKKVGLIGLSNTYDVGLLKTLERECGRGVQVIQNRWYQGNDWDKEVVKYCRQRGIMYQSFWTLSGSPTLLSHPDLRSIAKSSKKTEAQVIFKLAQLNGVVPISGTTSELHMKEDVAVEYLELLPGNTEQVQAVQELLF